MATFSALPSDLDDRVAYELDAIEYLRATLCGQNETMQCEASLTLGDVNEDGQQKVRSFGHATTDLSEGAVRNALDRFRPLMFSATFKMQDMIAEWILQANGVNKWRFSEKLNAYDNLRGRNNLLQPSLFTQRRLIGEAFWELYRFFVPFRGTAVHSGGLILDQDGTMEITRGADTLRLTPLEQASYMRAMCIIAKILLGLVKIESYLEGLIEGDLLQLEKYHGQRGFTVRLSRLGALTVDVPLSHIANRDPLSIRVDFGHLRRTMERVCPVGPSGRLYFSVTIVVHGAGREAVWQFPVESVPLGLTNLCEGDGKYDRFLTVTT